MDKFFDFLYKIIEDIKEKSLSFSIVSLIVFIVTFLIFQKIEVSSFMTTIATCGLVWVSVQQIKIQKSQHNLILFGKRWEFWQKVKSLRSKVLKCKHLSIEESGPIFHKIKEMERQSSVLFGSDIEEEINEISKKFEQISKGKERFNEIDKKLKSNQCITDFENSDINEGNENSSLKEEWFLTQKNNDILVEDIGCLFDHLALMIEKRIKELK